MAIKNKIILFLTHTSIRASIWHVTSMEPNQPIILVFFFWPKII